MGFAQILGVPVFPLPNSHGLTIPDPRAIQRVPLRFHPCCVPVLFCDQIVSSPRHGLLVAGLRVTSVHGASRCPRPSPFSLPGDPQGALLGTRSRPVARKTGEKKKRKKGKFEPPFSPDKVEAGGVVYMF